MYTVSPARPRFDSKAMLSAPPIRPQARQYTPFAQACKPCWLYQPTHSYIAPFLGSSSAVSCSSLRGQKIAKGGAPTVPEQGEGCRSREFVTQGRSYISVVKIWSRRPAVGRVTVHPLAKL